MSCWALIWSWLQFISSLCFVNTSLHNVMIDWRWVAEGRGGGGEGASSVISATSSSRQLGSRPLEQLECPQPSPAGEERSVGLSREQGEPLSQWGPRWGSHARLIVKWGPDVIRAVIGWSTIGRGSWLVSFPAGLGGGRRSSAAGAGQRERAAAARGPDTLTRRNSAQFLSSLLVDLSEA